jgi:hypothetical protein
LPTEGLSPLRSIVDQFHYSLIAFAVAPLVFEQLFQTLDAYAIGVRLRLRLGSTRHSHHLTRAECLAERSFKRREISYVLHLVLERAFAQTASSIEES